MKKIILIFLLSFIFNTLLVNRALAVTKTSGDLEVTFDEPLFPSSTVWYPGLAITKSMTVKNNGSDSQTVSLEAINKSQTGSLAGVLFFQVLEGGTDRYGGAGDKTLQNFWDDGEVSLSTLAGGSTATYDLTVRMATSAGNEYQAKEAKFDLRVGFLGTTAQVTVAGGGDGGGGGGGAAAPPVCSDTKPGTPTNFTVVGGPAVGQVSLSWTSPNPPYTYFLIAYSDSSSWPAKWGNPNIGNVNSFTVSGLGSGTYWFWLRAGNGCMPGDFTGPVSPGAIAGIPGAPAVAPGFAPGVLGAKTEKEEEQEPGVTITEGEVAGVTGEGKEGNQILLWILGLGGLLTLISIGYLVFRRHSSP